MHRGPIGLTLLTSIVLRWIRPRSQGNEPPPHHHHLSARSPLEQERCSICWAPTRGTGEGRGLKPDSGRAINWRRVAAWRRGIQSAEPAKAQRRQRTLRAVPRRALPCWQAPGCKPRLQGQKRLRSRQPLHTLSFAAPT